MLSARPLTVRLRLRHARHAIHEEAAETVEIAPAIERHHPPAISLPDKVYKLRQIADVASSHNQMEWLRAGRRRHAATTTYRTDDALVSDGRV
ncbi:MAG TPA: hypothetical protein PK264_07195 [Hyphomicrobiaceae bacterium]|nr:hypothetical protein [Hyphomicrobiaceae bacterium]